MVVTHSMDTQQISTPRNLDIKEFQMFLLVLEKQGKNLFLANARKL